MNNLKTFAYIVASLMLLCFISTIKADNTLPIETIVFDDVQQDPYSPSPIAQQTAEKVMWCKKDKDCSVLVEAAYYEARGEVDMGVVSVMHTILNRVNKEGRWPNTIKEVVYQNKQFSYTWDGSLKRGMNNTYQVDRVSVLAYDVLHGEVESPVGWATHYHSINVKPYWGKDLDYVAHIGNHIFYRGDR